MRPKQIVVIGGGFAGVWAALGAAAVLHEQHAASRVRVTLVSADGYLVIRPRLYEADLGGVRVPLAGVLAPVGVEQRRAVVSAIDVDTRELTLSGENPGVLRYDELVLCAGSRVLIPGEPGTVHSVDSFEDAIALHHAINALSVNSDRPLTATVIGAGFTGLEVATELSDVLNRVARQAGRTGPVSRVRIIEQAPDVAPEFGPNARSVIRSALDDLEVETLTGVRVSSFDRDGVTFADGQRVESGIVVWAAGPKASVLNEQLGVELDGFRRVTVNAHMATDVDGVWAAGDSASAVASGKHVAVMSCQQAMPQGRQAGDNAARKVLGHKLGEYRQPLYVTCLDLGSAGAVLTRGFDRDDVIARGADAKEVKQFINRSVIYPPTDTAGLLKLGSAKPPGPVGAAFQTFALRRKVLRHAAVTQGENRAAEYAALETE